MATSPSSLAPSSLAPAAPSAPSALSPTADALLDAALDLFHHVGYAAAPVPEIARRAGVAVGSVYRYFAGKEQLVNALYRREKQRLMAAVIDGLEVDAEPQTVFRELWSRLATFTVEHPMSVIFLELHHHETYLDDESRAVARAIDESIATLVRSWQAAGAVRSGDPDVLHALAVGGFVAVVRRRISTGQPITPSIGDETAEATWGLLATREDQT